MSAPLKGLKIIGIDNMGNTTDSPEYLRALARSGSAICPHAVKRIECSSATRLRTEMIEARGSGDPFLCRDDFSDLLLHALCGAYSAEDLARYLDVSQDLAGRILKELPGYTTFTGFCDALKTRNYTYTRISRALLHILLGMKTETMQYFDRKHGLCGWIRPIGFSADAAPLIRSVTASCTVPFLDKLSRAGDRLSGELQTVLRQELQAPRPASRAADGQEGAAAGPLSPSASP